jgi:hypothetical protein
MAMESTQAAPPTLLLNATEASRQLAISPRTLWAISAPRGPVPVVRIGRSVRYDPLDLRDWLEAQKIGGPRS